MVRWAILMAMVVVLTAGCNRPPKPTMGMRNALEQGNIAEVESALYWRESKIHGGVNHPLDKIDGAAPIHVAAAHGHVKLVEFLIDEGAKIDSPGHWGYMMTALHLAAQNGHAGVVRVLLAHDADTVIKDRDGRTALDLARDKGHAAVVALLTAPPVPGK